MQAVFLYSYLHMCTHVRESVSYQLVMFMLIILDHCQCRMLGGRVGLPIRVQPLIDMRLDRMVVEGSPGVAGGSTGPFPPVTMNNYSSS